MCGPASAATYGTGAADDSPAGRAERATHCRPRQGRRAVPTRITPRPAGRARVAAPVRGHRPAGTGPRRRQPSISPAASVAPSSQQASRSALVGSPATLTAVAARCQPRPVVTDSMPRTAPVVSLPPCT